MSEFVIPILPCRNLKETLAFYKAMGFEITCEQTSPNAYGCVRWGGIELQFFVLKNYNPEQSYSTCYVGVSDVDRIYQSFTESLRSTLGKVPKKGIPRIGPVRLLSYGERRFNVVDPGGNWIRIGQQVEMPSGADAGQADQGPLARAVHTAALLAHSKGDISAAVKVLDVGLRKVDAAPADTQVRALILRADLAMQMDDRPLAAELLARADRITVSDVERGALAETFATRAEIEQALAEAA